MKSPYPEFRLHPLQDRSAPIPPCSQGWRRWSSPFYIFFLPPTPLRGTFNRDTTGDPPSRPAAQASHPPPPTPPPSHSLDVPQGASICMLDGKSPHQIKSGGEKSETKNQPKDQSFRPDIPADIRPKTSVRPSKSWKKNKHFGTDMPRGRPRKNFGLKNFGLIFRSLKKFLMLFLGILLRRSWRFICFLLFPGILLGFSYNLGWLSTSLS